MPTRHRYLLTCQVGEIPLAGAYAVAWSPAGAYLQTFERPSRELGNAHKNLKVWSCATHLHAICCLSCTGLNFILRKSKQCASETQP